MTTETKHETLRKLHEAATPGKWETAEEGSALHLIHADGIVVADFDYEEIVGWEQCSANAALIVHLRNNVEHYIAQDARIAELEAENARLREALQNMIPLAAHAEETVKCRGDKCRKTYCISCSGEVAAELATESIKDRVDQARAALGEQP